MVFAVMRTPYLSASAGTCNDLDLIAISANIAVTRRWPPSIWKLMSDIPTPPRKRSRIGLFIMPGVLVVLAIGWTIFWFFASAQVNTQFERWRAREAQSGREYNCGQ